MNNDSVKVLVQVLNILILIILNIAINTVKNTDFSNFKSTFTVWSPFSKPIYENCVLQRYSF